MRLDLRSIVAALLLVGAPTSVHSWVIPSGDSGQLIGGTSSTSNDIKIPSQPVPALLDKRTPDHSHLAEKAKRQSSDKVLSDPKNSGFLPIEFDPSPPSNSTQSNESTNSTNAQPSIDPTTNGTTAAIPPLNSTEIVPSSAIEPPTSTELPSTDQSIPTDVPLPDVGDDTGVGGVQDATEPSTPTVLGSLEPGLHFVPHNPSLLRRTLDWLQRFAI
ncbi:hypothetical protein B0A52_10033 [Exophiala mesophila]|uniref:Uncharacterized protein n=1 Tax=Exophiala mesophila TaxID=212818 RepID=A0A438MR59_EXOME|nr:hypothetical protein B0A52_10033 [Exophiala mesophila]